MASRFKDSEEMQTTDYGQHVLSRMGEFYQSELLCDFKLIVEGQVFKVHRLVLASASDYFRAMFSHNMMESRKNYLELKGLSADGVRPLIKFAYCGKLTLNMSNIEVILSASTFLQVTPAVELCTKYLKSKLGFDNAEDIVRLGDTFGISELKEHYRKYVLENFLEFAETDAFLKLSSQTLAGYLLSDSLNSPSEMRLLKCVLKWYNYKKKERDSEIYDVVEKIRFVNDGWPLIEFARSAEPFTTNKQCDQLLQWCIHYMQTPHRNHLCLNHRGRVRCDRQTLVQIGGEIEFEYEDYFPEPYFNVDMAGQRGGTPQNQFFHTDCKSWFPLGVVGISDARSHCVVVEVNNYGILIGGYIHQSTEKHATNEVKILTPGASSGKDFALWDMQYMNIERAHHTAVAIPGYLVVVGGRNDQHHLKSVEMFDLDREKWMLVRPLAKPLFNHASAAYKGKVYISGGVQQGEVIAAVSCYDPARDRWESKTPMLAARSGHTMTTLDRQLVICGGRICLSSTNTRCLSSVESFDPETNQWTFLAPMRYDCSFMTATVLNDKLMIAGGENSVSALMHIVQEYCPRTNKWGLFTILPKPMKNMGLCSLFIKLNCNPDRDAEDGGIGAAFDNMFLHDSEDWYDDYVEYTDWDEQINWQEPLM